MSNNARSLFTKSVTADTILALWWASPLVMDALIVNIHDLQMKASKKFRLLSF